MTSLRASVTIIVLRVPIRLSAVRARYHNASVLSALKNRPAWLVALRNTVAARLPPVDLPELLLEIDARTGFAGTFTHASEADARARDLPTSVCAVLLAEACNTTGPEFFPPIKETRAPLVPRARPLLPGFASNSLARMEPAIWRREARVLLE
jgi:Tn3 transposase DDE domain